MRPSAFSPSLRAKLAPVELRRRAEQYLRREPAPFVATVAAQKLGALTVRVTVRHDGVQYVAAGRTVPLALLALASRVDRSSAWRASKKRRAA